MHLRLGAYYRSCNQAAIDAKSWDLTQESTTRMPNFSTPREEEEAYETNSLLSMALTSMRNTENHGGHLDYDVQIHYEKENPHRAKICRDLNDLVVVKKEDHYKVFDPAPCVNY